MSRLIDADALWMEIIHSMEYCDDFLEIIEKQPTVEPERKKGKWLPDNNAIYETRFVCSNCHESQVVPTIGFRRYKPIWDYCPMCGSYNGGDQDEDNGI